MADGERTGKPKAEHFTNYPSPITGKNTTNVFGTPAKDIFIIHELSIKLFLFGSKRVTSYMKHHFIGE